MPRFRYIVFEKKKKKDRAGYISADSIEDARKRLNKRRGVTVKQVWPAGEETPKEEESPSDSFGLVFHEQKKEILVPRSDGQYRRDLGQRFGSLSPSKGLVNFLLVLLAALGLLLLPSYWGKASSVRGPSQGFDKVRVRLEVPLYLNGGSLEPEKIRATVRFPQIPYSLTIEGESSIDSQGLLSKELEFATRETPGYCELVIEGEGLETKKVPRLVFQPGEVLLARSSTVGLSRER